jgi:hypothetical protein
VCDYFGLVYDPDPHPGDPISISKDEFLDACDQLAAAGIPMRADRDAAWFDFTGWRVNYDVPLLSLAGFVMVPYAPWSSDRSLRFQRARLRPGRSRGDATGDRSPRRRRRRRAG